MPENPTPLWLPAVTHGAFLAIGVLIGLRLTSTGPAHTSGPPSTGGVQASRPSDSAGGENPGRAQRRPRETRAAASDGTLKLLADGSAIVPPPLLDRIRIRAMDTEGNVSPAELALIGLGEADAEELQRAITRVQNDEREREARAAQVIRQDDELTVIWIPGAGEPSGGREIFETKVDEIFGPYRPLVASALSHIGWTTGDWGVASKVVTIRPLEGGIHEYKLYRYDPSRPPDLAPGTDFAFEAMGTRTSRMEAVPAHLRHLFE